MSDLGEMHVRAGRYIGVAPIPGGLANVCLVRPSGPADGDKLRRTLIFPTGKRESSVVAVSILSPGKIRVGEPYNYEISVTNLTSAPLANVTINEVTQDAHRGA